MEALIPKWFLWRMANIFRIAREFRRTPFWATDQMMRYVFHRHRHPPRVLGTNLKKKFYCMRRKRIYAFDLNLLPSINSMTPSSNGEEDSFTRLSVQTPITNAFKKSLSVLTSSRFFSLRLMRPFTTRSDSKTSLTPSRISILNARSPFVCSSMAKLREIRVLL